MLNPSQLSMPTCDEKCKWHPSRFRHLLYQVEVATDDIYEYLVPVLNRRGGSSGFNVIQVCCLVCIARIKPVFNRRSWSNAMAQCTSLVTLHTSVRQFRSSEQQNSTSHHGQARRKFKAGQYHTSEGKSCRMRACGGFTSGTPSKMRIDLKGKLNTKTSMGCCINSRTITKHPRHQVMIFWCQCSGSRLIITMIDWILTCCSNLQGSPIVLSELHMVCVKLRWSYLCSSHSLSSFTHPSSHVHTVIL